MKKQREAVGIDIGRSTLKIILMSLSGSAAKLLNAEIKEIPELNPDERIAFIKTSLAEFFKIPEHRKDVYIALSDPDVEINRIDLPSMPQSEIPGALKWKLKDKLSFETDKSSISFDITDEYKSGDGTTQFCVMAEAVQLENLKNILSIFEGLRLNVAGINAVSFGLTNLVKPSGTTAVINIGHKSGYISIFKNAKLVFVRPMPVSSSQLTNSMCGVLVSDKGRMELSYNEAENIKKQYGIPNEAANLIEDKIPSGQILALIRPVIERLSVEVQRTFSYYTAELKGEMPEEISITGGGGRLKRLDKFLTNELGIKTEYMKLPTPIENKTNIDPETMLSFMGVIGIVLTGQKPNLLPPEFMAKKTEKIEWASLRMISIAAFSLLAVVYILASVRVSGYKRQLDNALKHKEIIKEVVELQNKIIERAAAVAKIKEGEVSHISILKTKSKIIPKNIVLQELSVNEDKKTVDIKGIIYLNGAVPEDELTRFMEKIESSTVLKNADLVSVTKDEREGKPIAQFEINCSL